MKTQEIKRRLIEKINQTDNGTLLNELFEIINHENNLREVYTLSDDQQLAVSEGREQIKNGDYLTDEEANKEIDKWLEE